MLVAEEAGRIVGMLELRCSDHIAMLFVEARGQGMGGKLVEQGLAICRESDPGVEEVRVHSSRYAVPIYRALGFEAEGPERTEHGITYLPMVFRFKAGDQGATPGRSLGDLEVTARPVTASCLAVPRGPHQLMTV